MTPPMVVLQLLLGLATVSLVAWGRILLVDLELVETAELMCLAASSPD